jgi:CBS-domain-containing membrane protein
MTSEVICCAADESVEQAAERLAAAHGSGVAGRIPVTDSEGRLVGVVSVDDLKNPKCGHRVSDSTPHALESDDPRIDFDRDQVGYMSDGSFPASDPPAPPTTLGSR